MLIWFDNTIVRSIPSGSGTSLSFVGRLQSTGWFSLLVGQTQWLILMVPLTCYNDWHDIRTFRLNSSDGSSDSNDRIILNGTEFIFKCWWWTIIRTNWHHIRRLILITDVRSETKTGDDSEVVMLLENGTQETGSDKLILSGTDGSSTIVNDNVLVEDRTGNVVLYTNRFFNRVCY